MSSAAPDPTPRRRLRDDTAAAHERVDGAFARFDLGARGDYTAFLAAHAEAFLPVEDALDRFGATQLIADWPKRRRSEAIRGDLAALGQAANAGPQFAIGGDAAAWGALYVLEGSRLGGALLARGVPSGLPTYYLAAAQPAGAWRRLLAALDAALDTDGDYDIALAAALAVFARFERAAAGSGAMR